jgi:hypothetical protein
LLLRTLTMAVLTALLAAPGSAAMRLDPDPRLSEPIKLSTTGEQVTTLLQQVGSKVGAKLTAAAPMGDQVVVVRFEGTAQEFMEQLGRFFAASASNPARWIGTGTGTSRRWRLERDLVTRKAVAELKEERERNYLRRLGTLFRSRDLSPEQWQEWKKRDATEAAVMKQAVERAGRGAQVMWHFSRLPEAQQQHVLSGGSVTYSVADLARDHPDPDRFIREWMGEGQPHQPDRRSQVTFYSVGRGHQRGVFVRLDYGPVRPSLSTTTGVCGWHLFTDMEQEDQAERWRARLGVKATAPTTPVTLAGQRQERVTSTPPVRNELWRVAEQANINLIADDYGWTYRDAPMVGKLTLKQIMDGFCGQPSRWDLREVGDGTFWWRSGDTYMLRSLSWPEDEQLNIPHANIQRWKAARAKRGLLPIETLGEMSAVKREQLPLLAIWFPEAEKMADVQTLLRWYHRAAPAVKQRITGLHGVSLADLGLDQERAFKEQDPASDDEAMWKTLLLEAPPANVRLSLVYDQIQLGRGGPEQLCVVVVVRAGQKQPRFHYIPLHPGR